MQNAIFRPGIANLTALTASLLSLVACESKYDIEVKCWKDDVFIGAFESPDGDVDIWTCYTPEFFEVRCQSSTVQKISGEILCSTSDRKKVRIKEYSPTSEEVKVMYVNQVK